MSLSSLKLKNHKQSMSSFEKVFKAAKGSIKTALDIAIGNGMAFSVQNVPVSDADGEFPTDEAVESFLWSYVKDEMNYKPLNEKALAGMKKNWEATHSASEPFVPKKQAAETLVALVAPSETAVHVVFSIPASETRKPQMLIDFQPSSELKLDTGAGVGARTISHVIVQPTEDDTAFKLRDTICRDLLADMKRLGIYVDTDEDEAIVNYLED